MTLHGVQFLMQTSENLNWLVFASEPITLFYDGKSGTKITSLGKFTGVLRFALIPPLLDQGIVQKKGWEYESVPLSMSPGVKRLVYHAQTYPVGARLSWDFEDLKTTSSYDKFTNTDVGVHDVTVGSINFDFETKSMHDDPHATRASSNGHDTSLLMLALPHHAEVLPSNKILREFGLEYQCIKGTMTPILGSSWSYDEHLTRTKFDDIEGLRNLELLDSKTKKTILKQVGEDLTMVLPGLDGNILPSKNGNIYGFGKQLARLAQLTHIASVLEEQDDVSSEKGNPTSLAQKAIGLLHHYVTKFLDEQSADNVLYDINFGGLISEDGIKDRQNDFGNGW